MTAKQQTLQQLIPTAKATGIIGTLITGAFMAGVGAILGFGDYADVPEDIAVLQSQMVRVDSTISVLSAGIAELQLADQQQLCLARLTATGIELTPLEVQALLEDPEDCP